MHFLNKLTWTLALVATAGWAQTDSILPLETAPQPLSIVDSAPVKQITSNAKIQLAVLPLECNDVTETQGKILADQLRNGLQKVVGYQVVERGQMDFILQEQGFQQSGACNSSACIVQVGQLMGVDQMVAGSVGKLGELWVLSLRRIDVQTGAVLQTAEVKLEGRIEDLLLQGIPKAVAAISGKEQPVVVASGVDQGTFAPAQTDLGLSFRLGFGMGPAFGMSGLMGGVGYQWNSVGVTAFGTMFAIKGLLGESLVGRGLFASILGVGVQVNGPMYFQKVRPWIQFHTQWINRASSVNGDFPVWGRDHAVQLGSQYDIEQVRGLVLVLGVGAQKQDRKGHYQNQAYDWGWIPTGSLGLQWVF